MENPRRILYMDMPVQKSRSVSPMSPSPCGERVGIIEMINRRLGRRPDCFHNEEDCRSSSTDSYSSNGLKRISNPNLETASSNSESGSNSSHENAILCLEKEESSQRTSSNLRRSFQNFSLSSRSSSCSSTAAPEKEKNKEKKAQSKSILRQPIRTAYVKGMSGLPTKRVPVSTVCCRLAH